MTSSRRELLIQWLAAGGTALVAGCSRQGSDTPTGSEPSSSRSQPHPTAPPGFQPVYLQAERDGRLAKLEEELWDVFGSCRCCPRECGANRLAGETGECRSTAQLKVASASPHFGEERPLVGRRGSGTIFFSDCNLRCCFCQNWEINHRGDGDRTSHAQLASMMLDLQKQGCHNINLVTPTHVVPHVVKALRLAVGAGLRLPIVYNTGGYDQLDIIQKLADIVDIYLPDFKFQDAQHAGKYCHKAFDYPKEAASVIKEMHRQVGRLQVDEEGVAVRGLIIRHLVMPRNLAGTDRFVRWVARELGPDTAVNIMAQYRPEYRANSYPEIARRLTSHEWRQATRWTEEAGLTNLL